MTNKTSLYLVATPIGNLSDITLRAIEILKTVDYILSEDTRRTSILLRTYGIQTQQISYRDQNHARIISDIVSKMNEGKTFALVSDAGTPVVSDPGYKLVKEVLASSHEVSPVPGASSVLAALSASGCTPDKFVFLGFMPKSQEKKLALLKKYGDLEASVVMFETPYQIDKLLEVISSNYPERFVCVSAEITKTHERFIRGSAGQIMTEFKKPVAKGEFVVIMSKEEL